MYKKLFYARAIAGLHNFLLISLIHKRKTQDQEQVNKRNKNTPKTTDPEKTNFKQFTKLQPLKLLQLDEISGGLSDNQADLGGGIENNSETWE